MLKLKTFFLAFFLLIASLFTAALAQSGGARRGFWLLFFSRARRDESHREKCNHYRQILASSVPMSSQLRPPIVPWSTLCRARLGA